MCLFLPTGLHAEKRTDEQRDYGGNRLASLTEKMPNLLKLRHQLKLLVVGDSRGECGIEGQLFYSDGGNQKQPIAFNASTPYVGFDVVFELMKTYVPHPRLEWLSF